MVRAISTPFSFAFVRSMIMIGIWFSVFEISAPQSQSPGHRGSGLDDGRGFGTTGARSDPRDRYSLMDRTAARRSSTLASGRARARLRWLGTSDQQALHMRSQPRLAAPHRHRRCFGRFIEFCYFDFGFFSASMRRVRRLPVIPRQARHPGRQDRFSRSRGARGRRLPVTAHSLRSGFRGSQRG